MNKTRPQVLLSVSFMAFIFMISGTAVYNENQQVSATKIDVTSPTGGCIPGGPTCVPCDPGLGRIGAYCIPSSDWKPSGAELKSEEDDGRISPDIKPPIQEEAITRQSPTSSNAQPQTSSGNLESNDKDDNAYSSSNANSSPNNLQTKSSSNLEQQQLPSQSIVNQDRKTTGNSPVPPECPMKGPIPLNCTMKPKF